MKKLWYDAECPICSTFKSELEDRLNGEIEFLPIESTSQNFKYENEEGSYEGRFAISVLMDDFPNLLPSLSILPEDMKAVIMKTLYSLSSMSRTLYKKTVGFRDSLNKKKGCNCGK
jgi:hypothetical protein